MENKIIPIRLSHSSFELFNRCERMFQIEKLLAGDQQPDESADFSLGKGFGVGVADYLAHQNVEQAIYKAWLEYWPEIETDKKSVVHMLGALQAAFPKLDTMLQDYEVVSFNGKPAVELSFRVNISPRYYYVGYVDVVLRNKWDGICIVVDAKTTGSNLLDLSAMYENSGQVVGYSIALDKIVGENLSSYAVGYFTAQLKKDYEVVIHPMVFKKTLLDRLNWLITLGSDIRRLETAEELEFFPRRGGSCVKFNRVCKHFGVCNLSSLDTPKKLVEDETVYDFVFEIDDLIDDHLRRIS